MVHINTNVRQWFSAARILGTGEGRVSLLETELYKLMLLAIADLQWDAVEFFPGNESLPLVESNYYERRLSWFTEVENPPNLSELLASFAKAVEKDLDFSLYFLNLCSLHKRRTKYQRILSTQPRPTMDQIGPRSLLEYGFCHDDLLASWMIWRKWIFDIDNRAGQETGYLFEPILASCIGGESVSSKNSPVRRVDASGIPTKGGRQIDCYVGDSNLAYEFKLRVTIAASGQGRFGEELSFPVEARAAGLKPILIVLDPTPSSRLNELKKAFEAVGGECFVGDSAWAHLDNQAGKIMSVFLEKYLRPPILEMTRRDDVSLEALVLRWTEDSVSIESNDSRYIFLRSKTS